jgi:hypothetical protein
LRLRSGERLGIGNGQVLARNNGWEDRIVFLSGLSREIVLPEPVDVLVTDTFGICGLEIGGLQSVIDARERFLKTGGALMPMRIEFFVTPVELPAIYERDIDFWDRRLQGGRPFRHPAFRDLTTAIRSA